MRLCVETPVGLLRLTEERGAVTAVEPCSFDGGGAGDNESPLLLAAAAELRDYFAGQRREFDLPLAPAGTAFQRSVWRALQLIPYGETRTYGEIAAAVGRPKACRAVGMACHRNPLPILIPCHRVVGAGGTPGGFAWGPEAKRALLRLEGVALP